MAQAIFETVHNTKQITETKIYAFSWIRTRSPSNRGAAEPMSQWLGLFSSQTFSRINTPTFLNLVILHTYPPMKMEQAECSETSAYKIQKPGNYPEESIQHSEHGESLKSRILSPSLPNT